MARFEKMTVTEALAAFLVENGANRYARCHGLLVTPYPRA